MKNFILIITLFSTCLLFAQVPRQSIRDSDISGDIDDVPVVSMEDSYGSKNRTQVFNINEGEKYKYGLKRNDSVLLKPIYERIDYSDIGFIIKSNGLSGFANTNGTIILNVEFDSIGTSTNSLIVKKSGKYGVFDKKGTVFVPIKHSRILYANSTSKLALIQGKDNLTQLFLKDKIVTIPFDNILLYENLAILNKDAKKGLILDGKLAYAVEYDNISQDGKSAVIQNYMKKILETKRYFDFRNRLDAVILEKDKKFGLVANGELIYPVAYDKVYNEYFRYIVVVEKSKLKGAYLINSKKKLDVIYDDIHLDGVQYIEVKKDKLSGMLDYNLNVILPLEYDDIQVSNGGFTIIKNKKQGWADLKGTVLIPPIYDNIDVFQSYGSNQSIRLYKVQNNQLTGLIDGSNKIILPLEFDYIFDRNDFICGKTKEGKFGLYRYDGTEVLKPEYNFIFESMADGSKVLFAQNGVLYTILDKNGAVIYENSVKKYTYIHDEENLLSPLSRDKKSYLAVQDDKNKFGIFEEINEQKSIPFAYDEIKQKITINKKAYFLVRKDKKFGVIDEQNTVAIPFEYDDLNFDLLNPYSQEIVLPAKKANKYGLISFTNKVVVPFTYQDIQRISSRENIFKAKSNNKYYLIDGVGKKISNNNFDNIANFEGDKALSFSGKTMKVIKSDGQFTGVTEEMTIQNGYKSFEDLKQALITALDSPTNDLLLEFCTKIAPSKHVLFYLKTNIFDDKTLYDVPSQELIAKQYFKELVEFKMVKWSNEKYYRKSELVFVNDYTLYSERGYVTNRRKGSESYGDRLLERLLRNSIKVNGYWISSYFMDRRFKVNDY